MSQPTSIGWCVDPRTGRQGHSWGIVRGCSHESEGCERCYLERNAARFSGPHLFGSRPAPFAGFALSGPPRWTGRVEIMKHKLPEPLHRRIPTMYFVFSDLFHEKLSDEDIDQVFAVMALCPQHLFLVLTKRAKRMHDWATRSLMLDLLYGAAWNMTPDPLTFDYPLPNVWLGASVENDKHLDRLEWLLKTPAALRFVSLEPMLSGIDLNYPKSVYPDGPPMCCNGDECGCRGMPIDPPLLYGLGWVILGGETGPGARPMNPAWARKVRDDCIESRTPFFFKSRGEWATNDVGLFSGARYKEHAFYDGVTHGRTVMLRVGHKAAGRLLDGGEWNQMPEVT